LNRNDEGAAVARRVVSFATDTAVPRLPLRVGLTDANGASPSVRRVSKHGLLQWLADEFVNHSPRTVFRFFDFFGYHMWNLSFAYDPAACADLSFLRTPVVVEAKSLSPGESVRLVDNGELSPAAVAVLMNVFEHYSRSVASSPYVGSGAGVPSASPDCVAMMLIQGGWERRKEAIEAITVAIGLWPLVEREHVDAAPFTRGGASTQTTAGSLLMTFEGNLTAKGFLLFIKLLAKRYGEHEIGSLMYELGFNSKLQHAINRGSMDNVHRPQAIYCPCASRDKAWFRLLAAEENKYRAFVEQQLHRQQEDKQLAVKLRSHKSLQVMRSPSRVQSNMVQRRALSAAGVKQTEEIDDSIAPFVVESAVAPRPTSFTPAPAPPPFFPLLSPALHGKGPLAAPVAVVPRSITPSGFAKEQAKEKRQRKKLAGRGELDPLFNVGGHLDDSATVYKSNGAISTFNAVQRKILRM
jgi:hypothetical protein